MEFIETFVFSKKSLLLLGDEGIWLLQKALILYPLTGAVIPGSGGLRKMRWFSLGKGKKGGLRVIYYFVTSDNKIFLLYIYEKSKTEDLDLDFLKKLKLLVEENN